MKKIIYILTVLLAAGTTSCKKFLEEENLGGITSESYYTDEAGYERLVNACYASLRDIYDVHPNLFEWGTDVTTRGETEPISGSLGDREVRAIQLNEYRTLSSDNSAVNSFFTNAYAAIQRCNTAIEQADKIPGLNAGIKNKRVAEMRFLRAYYYYLLVENFGNVPIVKEVFDTPVTHFVPNTEQEVYDYMIAELNAALPDADPAASQAGRVTQGAVKHLLALVHLTRGYKTFGTSNDFTLAAKLAEEVIGSGTYTLLPSFADVFRANNQTNKEIIFSVQYDAASLRNRTVGNSQNIVLGWRIWREPGFYEGETAQYNRRASDFMPTQFLYTLFNTAKDTRYDATFQSEYRAVRDDASRSIKAGDLRFFFPKWDQEFSAADEAALKASNPKVEVIRFDQWKQNFQGIGGALKFPMVNKFLDPTATYSGPTEGENRSTRDVFLFRLAETYLIAAEAYFKLGQNDKAADKLNFVRNRAAKAGESLAITAADVSLDLILDERARELVGEYKRWLDLKRTRTLARAFEHNILTKMANPNGLNDKYYLRPIPQTVIDRDTGGYPQNKDY